MSDHRVGYVVHYVNHQYEHLAAIITGTRHDGDVKGVVRVDLAVIGPSDMLYTHSVPFSASGEPHTWHWNLDNKPAFAENK